MKPESNRPVSIEDLLRLKRAERPPAEFWTQFDRKLREKQLAALVARRPWWQRLPQVVPTFARYRFILGGTAVAVLALATFRDEPADRPLESVEPVTVAETVMASPQSDTSVTGTYVAVEEFVPRVAEPEVVAVSAPEASQTADLVVVEAEIAEPVMPENLSRLVALGGGSVAETFDESASRHLAASLTTVRIPESVSVSRLLGGTNGFEARAMPARTAIDPLQQMTPPGESRRSRLLTAMVSTAALETSARTTERAANRFAEEGVYDQIQRFGARGDRVNVKF